MSDATELMRAEPASPSGIALGRWRHRDGHLVDVLGADEGIIIYTPAEDRVSRYGRTVADFLAAFTKVEEQDACP